VLCAALCRESAALALLIANWQMEKNDNDKATLLKLKLG
jgi:hypothetical protein